MQLRCEASCQLHVALHRLDAARCVLCTGRGLWGVACILLPVARCVVHVNDRLGRVTSCILLAACRVLFCWRFIARSMAALCPMSGPTLVPPGPPKECRPGRAGCPLSLTHEDLFPQVQSLQEMISCKIELGHVDVHCANGTVGWEAQGEWSWWRVQKTGTATKVFLIPTVCFESITFDLAVP